MINMANLNFKYMLNGIIFIVDITFIHEYAKNRQTLIALRISIS